jgi:hypothetical protein
LRFQPGALERTRLPSQPPSPRQPQREALLNVLSALAGGPRTLGPRGQPAAECGGVGVLVGGGAGAGVSVRVGGGVGAGAGVGVRLGAGAGVGAGMGASEALDRVHALLSCIVSPAHQQPHPQPHPQQHPQGGAGWGGAADGARPAEPWAGFERRAESDSPASCASGAGASPDAILKAHLSSDALARVGELIGLRASDAPRSPPAAAPHPAPPRSVPLAHARAPLAEARDPLLRIGELIDFRGHGSHGGDSESPRGATARTPGRGTSAAMPPSPWRGAAPLPHALPGSPFSRVADNLARVHADRPARQARAGPAARAEATQPQHAALRALAQL